VLAEVLVRPPLDVTRRRSDAARREEVLDREQGVATRREPRRGVVCARAGDDRGELW